MSTVIDEFQAAIEKLRAQKSASTPAPWASGGRGYVETVPEFDLYRFDVMSETVARAELLDEDADLIVTLHATLDAQLEILTAALVEEIESAEYWAEVGRPHLRGPAKIAPLNRAVLTLARAINAKPTAAS
jgi:hypothetical protein